LQVTLDGVEGRIERPGVVGQQIVRGLDDLIELRQRPDHAPHPGHGRVDQGDLEHGPGHDRRRQVAGDAQRDVAARVRRADLENRRVQRRLAPANAQVWNQVRGRKAKRPASKLARQSAETKVPSARAVLLRPAQSMRLIPGTWAPTKVRPAARSGRFR